MKNGWICFRSHTGYGHDGLPSECWSGSGVRGPRICGSFSQFLFCQVFYHASDRVRNWFIRTGFVDAKGEGEVAFWRWDPWNAKMRHQVLDLEHKKWERKRAWAVWKWGA